ncbi:hypothetical protein [Kitasatospora sp. SolWspMP-SS2h]|uniref:hypothetical protein n=1 Tax=Kitasatospora sp. SolWspMP-SS2h TaxID=1305729 RepID=UPI000DB9FD98|nr:hypothetical protein [Kitasatospora sp. SolWspMP-SS2h]
MRLLVVQAGWSGAELAREVNRLGGESGLRLGYQRASVHQWMAGVLPRGPVAELVAEALSRRLGRRVTARETGLLPPVTASEPAVPADAGDPYGAIALSVPYTLPTAGLLPPAATRTPPVPKVPRATQQHAVCVELMAAHFSRSDHLSGSGHLLEALNSFFRHAVRPWLDAPAAPAARRDLLGACAHLAYVGGYLHLDAGRHGAAQHWYRLAAGLAEEGGHTTTFTAALRALSVQAHQLGHHAHALALAERSLAVAGTHTPPSPFLQGQLALALAARRMPAQARAALSAAEHGLDRHSASPPGPVAVYHLAAFTHQRAEVRLLLDDASGAAADLALSTRLRPADEPRTHALVLAQLGEVHLACGDLDRACDAWQRFLDSGAAISSRRLSDAHRTMRSLLRPHSAERRAADLLATAADWNRVPRPRT